MDRLPVTLPSDWAANAANGEFDGSLWRTTFNDRMLESIIEEALVHNYNLQAAAARLGVARANTLSNRSELFPTLNGSASGSEARRSTASGIQQTLTNETFGLNARFNWEIDLWGKFRNGYRAELAELQASEAEFVGARLSIAARAAQAWFDAIESKLQYDLAVRTIEALESSQEIVEENFRRGIATALEVRLVRANLATTRSSLEQRHRARDAAIRTLETLLGRYPANEIAIAAALPEMMGEVPPGLPSGLLLRRPDLVAAERRLAAAEQRKFEAGKERLPNISLTATRGTSSRELDQIFEFVDQRVWSQSWNIGLPIFTGGRLWANQRRARANYELVLANYASTALGAFREVEIALANDRSLARDLELQQLAAEESVAAESLAWEQYSRGLADITTALDAVRRSITAQRSLIQIENERIQSRLDLYLALGGGFEAEPESNL